MGVTTGQLIQMVSNGQLAANRFLPRLAEELNNVEGETKSLNKEVARLQNLWAEIRAASIGNLPLQSGLEGLNNTLETTMKIVKPLSGMLTALAGVALINLGVQAVSAALGIGMVKTALLGMGKALLAAAPPLIALAGGYVVLKSLSDSFHQNNIEVRSLNNELKKLASEGLAEVEEKVSGYQTQNISRFGEGIARLLGRRTASQRELNNFQDALGSSNQTLLDLTLDFKARINPESLAQVEQEIQRDLDRIDNLSYRINNREVFDLSKEEALDLQRQVDSITEGVEAKIETTFKPAELDGALKVVEKLEAEIAQKRKQGASDSDLKVLEDELTKYKRQIEEMRRQVRALQNITSPVMQNLREFRSASGAQGAELELSRIERLTESYGALAEMKAYSGTLSANATVDNLKNIEAEIASLDALKNKAQSVYGALNSSQKQDLANLLGTEDFNNVTRKQVLQAQQQLEMREQNFGKADQMVKAAVEALEGMEDLTRREKQLALEKLQAQTEIYNATRDLQNNMERMVVDNFAKEIEARKLQQELSNQGNPLLDNEMFNASRGLRDQERQNASLLRQQERAFSDFVRGLSRATEDMRAAAERMGLEVSKLDLSNLSSAISGMNNFAKAAGIDDPLGLTGVRDLIAQAIGISAGDNRPGIRLEMENQQRSFNRTREDQIRQREELNYNIANAIADAKERELQFEKQKIELQQKSEISMDEMLLKVQQFNLSVQEQNRGIAEANQTAQVYGVNRRVSSISVPAFDLDRAMEQQDYAANYLENINDQMMRSQRELQSQLKAIAAKGNKDFQREMIDSQRAFGESMEANRQKLQSETRRLEVENSNLAETIKGTFHKVQKAMVDGYEDMVRAGREARNQLTSLFQKGGIFGTNYNPIEAQVSQFGGEISNQVVEFKRQARTYNELTNLFDENASRDSLLRDIKDLNKNQIDSGLKALIMSEINAATSDEDFHRILTKYEQQANLYEKMANDLGGRSQQLQDGLRQELLRQERAEEFNRLDDLKGMRLDNALNTPFVNDTQRRRLEAQQNQLRLNRELRNEYDKLDKQAFETGMTEVELAARKNELYNIYIKKLENANAKLSVGYDIGKAFESSIQGAFSNFGENLFGALTGDNELEKLKASAEYADKLREAQEKYADNPDQLAKVSERLEMLNKTRLDKIKNEFSVFGSIIGTVKNALVDFSKALVQMFAKMAATRVAEGLFGGLLGINKGAQPAVGLLGGIFKYGGTVGEALNREGQGAQLIVANKYEEILSAQNNDAQFFRSLKKNGTWDMMKNNGTANFKYGGMIKGGNNTVGGGNSFYNNTRQGNTVNITTNYNIKSKGSGFNRSHSQMLAEAEARNRRQYERNR